MSDTVNWGPFSAQRSGPAGESTAANDGAMGERNVDVNRLGVGPYAAVPTPRNQPIDAFNEANPDPTVLGRGLRGPLQAPSGNLAEGGPYPQYAGEALRRPRAKGVNSGGPKVALEKQSDSRDPGPVKVPRRS